MELIGETRLETEAGGPTVLSDWRRLGVPADVALPLLLLQLGLPEIPHRCQFLDFVTMIAEYQAIRRVVLALRERRQERKEAEAVLAEAIRLKKLEANL